MNEHGTAPLPREAFGGAWVYVIKFQFGKVRNQPGSSDCSAMISKFIYGLAIFSSAFLLFLVQPILGKIILPWFGGAAGVWIVCLLFFQIVLLLGYSYAHLLIGFKLRTQAWLHVTLIAGSLLSLPILPKALWRPQTPYHPALQILVLLAATAGLPYFLLASTSPLLQAWYARNRPGAVPYRFYALSNIGSMLALVGYPIVVEPYVATSRQGVGWSWAYAAVAALCALVAFTPRTDQVISAAHDLPPAPAPGWEVQGLWISLAACGSALLLAITHHITQNIAAVPLLWIIPLAFYLLSFILCFEGGTWYRRDFFLKLLGVALGSAAYALGPSFTGLPLKVSIPLFCCSLFIGCMFCHGELARLKPHPQYLTTFYLMVSLGGVLGATFVAVLAPLLYSGDYELQIVLGCCALLVLLVLHRDPTSTFYQARWQLPWLLVVAFAFAVIIRLGITAREESKDVRVMARNFYGVLRVVDQVAPNVVLVKAGPALPPPGDLRLSKLMNGTIDHGLQFLSPALRDRPTTYYGPDSGIGIALRAAGTATPLKVGVIGLGVGTIAAYGRPGDHYQFYEINPLVVRLANQEFTYLQDSPAKIETVLGDGRLSLQQEEPQGFNVLVVDAFSGDSIPVHLLTREAMALYFRHLTPDGVLALHVSNQYLNLSPVIAATAVGLGKEAVVVENKDDNARGIYRATWVLVGDRAGYHGQAEIRKAGTALSNPKHQAQWTDDFSSIFEVLL